MTRPLVAECEFVLPRGERYRARLDRTGVVDVARERWWHGWRPVAVGRWEPPHQRAELRALDGEPASEVLRRVVSDELGARLRALVRTALPAHLQLCHAAVAQTEAELLAATEMLGEREGLGG